MAASVANSDAPTLEKADVEQRSPQLDQKAKKGLFRRSQKPKQEEVVDEKGGAANTPAVPEQKQVPPVSIAALFRCVSLAVVSRYALNHYPHRFSTPFELTIDFLGLICAAAGGSAQVCGYSNPNAPFLTIVSSRS